MIFSKLKKSKNFKNTFWNITEVLLGPLILFVSIPIFLEQLGTQDYGIWMFTNTVIILLQTLNLGLNFSTYKHISVAITDEKWQKIKSILNVNLSLNIIIFFVSIVIVAILSSLIYYFGYFIENDAVKEKLIICLFIGVIILFSKLSEQILYNVYRAFEKFKYVTFLSVIIKLLIVIGNIVIVYSTNNIVYILAYTAFVSVLGLFVNYLFIRKLVPEYQFSLSYSKQLIREETKYSVFLWLQSIAVIVAYQGDRLLVSFGFGLTVLSYYAISATLFNHIHMAFSAIMAWLFPQIAKQQSEKGLVYEIYISARNSSTVISIVLLAVFCLLYEFLFTFWLGKEHYLQIANYIKWFSIFEFFFIFTIIPHFFLNASGYEKFSLKLVAMFTSINVIGMLIGYFVFNTSIALLIGLAISTIFSMFILHLMITKKFANNSFSKINLVLLFIPSLLGSGIPFYSNYSLKILFFVLCLLSLYLIYIKRFKTNFKLLTQ